jgi:light-regulated signal transduction histidine kinase (bacteriophytochrome)
MIVLENLLGNAWKFTGKRERGRIEVAIEERDGERAFCVRDNGAGFDMACAQRLFAPFQRMHDAREFEGTGIGLAIVSRIVSRHGGRIWADSVPDKGTSFYFTLSEREHAKP